MEGRARTPLAKKLSTDNKRPHPGGNHCSFSPTSFSIESFLVFVLLTAPLLVLPLILPPLPPPPCYLLLLPLGILVVLLIFAFVPSDARHIASSYL